jgi:hypothetical protein
MDINLKQEILRTIVTNENRMTTKALAESVTRAGYTIRAEDLRELQFSQTLALVDGNWIVQEWWKVK